MDIGISGLVPALEQDTVSHIFLVSGKSSFSLSGAEQLLQDHLKKYIVTTFSAYTPNPSLEDAVVGANLFRESGADCIMAVGGGSAIDIAKLVKALIPFKGNETDFLARDISESKHASLPLIAIPTTAGTGSEATHFAVVYHEGKKYSVASSYLLPNACVIDPTLTQSMPPYLTACSGIDALSQAIESFWNVNSTDKSREYASRAMTLCFEHLEPAVLAPNEDHRTQMARASFLAGKAINITKTTAPHAISYTLTSNYDIPHGHAVSMFLPWFLTYNFQLTDCDCNDSRGVDFVKARLLDIARLLGTDDLTIATKRLQSLIQNIGLESNMKDLGVPTSATRAIAEGVNLERLKNNPRQPSSDCLSACAESLFQRS